MNSRSERGAEEIGVTNVLLAGAISFCVTTMVLVGVLPEKASWASEQTRASELQGHTGFSVSKENSSTEAIQRVLVIGSSVAAGWHDDTRQGGFLGRAFSAESALLNTKFVVTNKSIPGAGATRNTDKYEQWVTAFRPDIVVLAWGGLDDAHDKTKISDFRKHVRKQIQTALDHRAVVFVITPPVTRASYTSYKSLQAVLMENEEDVARQFNNSNVYVFNVFDQMKNYLAGHGQSYQPYMADGWHPNSRGHILAAQLLTTDLFRTFGAQSISFHAVQRVD